MVVEDDAALREIYSIRITAEGYEVVSAGDGEEALAVAVREKPDLILSDVMMPKISGFDMLDIIRATPETANIKVVMMTALSSDDQRARGERLGADRYLVKSQVGIEDVINTIHEVLGDKPVNTTPVSAPAPEATAATPGATATAAAPEVTTPSLEVATPDATAPEVITPGVATPEVPTAPVSEAPTSPAPEAPAPAPIPETPVATAETTPQVDYGPVPPAAPAQ